MFWLKNCLKNYERDKFKNGTMLCVVIVLWIKKNHYLTTITHLFLALLGVKSGVESVILVFNLQNTKLQPIDETADDELFVVYNGPKIGEHKNLIYLIVFLLCFILSFCHSIFLNKAWALHFLFVQVFKENSF